MTKCIAFIISIGLLAAKFQAAQEPVYPPVTIPKANPTKGSKETVQQTKTITDSGTTKTSVDTLIGKVETFEPNKWIKVSTPGKIEGTRNIDLQGKDITAKVNPAVKEGMWVSVVEKTDANGHKTIAVEPSKHE